MKRFWWGLAVWTFFFWLWVCVIVGCGTEDRPDFRTRQGIPVWTRYAEQAADKFIDADFMSDAMDIVTVAALTARPGLTLDQLSALYRSAKDTSIVVWGAELRTGPNGKDLYAGYYIPDEGRVVVGDSLPCLVRVLSHEFGHWLRYNFDGVAEGDPQHTDQTIFGGGPDSMEHLAGAGILQLCIERRGGSL